MACESARVPLVSEQAIKPPILRNAIDPCVTRLFIMSRYFRLPHQHLYVAGCYASEILYRKCVPVFLLLFRYYVLPSALVDFLGWLVVAPARHGAGQCLERRHFAWFMLPP